jgi:hypothetical protein
VSVTARITPPLPASLPGRRCRERSSDPPRADGDGDGRDGRHLPSPDPCCRRRIPGRSRPRAPPGGLAGVARRRETAAGVAVRPEAVRVLAAGRVGLAELADVPRPGRQHGT